MRKREENSNPTEKKAENEINEFSQMNDSTMLRSQPVILRGA